METFDNKKLSVTGRRISTHVAKLLLKEPFYGVILSRLILKENCGVTTMGTNSIYLIYSTEFVDNLSTNELLGVIVHEAIHIALLHMFRIQYRDPLIYNYAADYVTNRILMEEGFELPDGALKDKNDRFRNMGVEAIYKVLYDEAIKIPVGSCTIPPGFMIEQRSGDKGDQQQNSSSGMDTAKQPGDDSQDESSSSKEASPNEAGTTEDKKDQPQQNVPQQALSNSRNIPPVPWGEFMACPPQVAKEKEEDWRITIVRAAKLAQGMGKLPGSMKGFLEDILQPKAPWREILWRFVTEVVRTSYTWARPNKRYLAYGTSLPTAYSLTAHFVIAKDTSGSISNEMLAQFSGEVSAILDTCYGLTAKIIYADASVQAVEEFGPGMPIKNNLSYGRGGTDFRPVFDYIEKEEKKPACLIYMTDGFGTFPQVQPDYPVLWAIVSDFKDIPFGERVEIID